MSPSDPVALARRCLPELGGVPVTAEPLLGGGNNRLYRVKAPGHQSVLKHYFRHPDQPRDRLGAEFTLLHLAWAGGIRCIPQPIARDDEAGAALYAFLPGERVRPADVSLEDVSRALSFLVSLNRAARADVPGALPILDAAEARFSVKAHVMLLDGRVARLSGLDVFDTVDREAAEFVRLELFPVWSACRSAILERLDEERPAWAGELNSLERVLSPSDFGFHNALRQKDGELAFVDFEYAGWDDPAKLVCDFFLQPAVPAPREGFDAFARGVSELVPDAAGVMARVALLWPLFAVKWCCILMNHFSRVGLARRTFALEGAAYQKWEQLEKARELLKGIA